MKISIMIEDGYNSDYILNITNRLKTKHDEIFIHVIPKELHHLNFDSLDPEGSIVMLSNKSVARDEVKVIYVNLMKYLRNFPQEREWIEDNWLNGNFNEWTIHQF